MFFFNYYNKMRLMMVHGDWNMWCGVIWH